MAAPVNREELRDLIASRQVIVIDALPPGYYDRQHLPGAINIVEADVARLAPVRLPDKSATIVTYCSNAACNNSQAVANRLEALGYTNVYKYVDGIQDWVEAGYDVVATGTEPVTGILMSSAPTREVNGIVLPQPGVWEIDPGHTDLAFTGRHFMITKVRGRFTDLVGSVVVAEDITQSRVEVTVRMASVESGNTTRDDHLRSAELFDVERYPEATFVSTSIEWSGAGGTVHGDLTIHGITRQVVFDVSFEGHARDPWGADRAIFSAHTQLNREDFGISWNMPVETGGLLVSKEISVDVELEAVLDTSVH
jgi:polyisoprenoid-binding protein YceI/rhodanese-related sulfurtransferase